MAKSRFKLAYTLGDLFFVVAIFGLAMALVNEFAQQATSQRRFIQSIWLPGDGSRLYAAFQDGGISSWDLATGNAATHLEPSSDLYYSDAPVVISPDGRLAARVLWSNPPPPESVAYAVQVCDLQTGQERYRRKSTFLGSMAFSPDGMRLAIDNPRDNTLIVVDLDHPERELLLSPLDTSGPKSEASAWNCPILFGNDGEVLYRLSTEGELTRWDLATGKPQRRQLEAGWHNLLQLAHSGELVVTTTRPNEAAGESIIEKRSSNDLQRVADPALLPRAYALASMNEGKSLAALFNGGSGLRVFYAENWKVQKNVGVDSQVWQLAARDSEHGPVIAIANDQTAWLLDRDRWRECVSLAPSHRRAIELASAVPLVCGIWLWMRITRQRLSASREEV
jgi:hypothetical protein